MIGDLWAAGAGWELFLKLFLNANDKERRTTDHWTSRNRWRRLSPPETEK